MQTESAQNRRKVQHLPEEPTTAPSAGDPFNVEPTRPMRRRSSKLGATYTSPEDPCKQGKTTDYSSSVVYLPSQCCQLSVLYPCSGMLSKFEEACIEWCSV